jgi:hypothetical protein
MDEEVESGIRIGGCSRGLRCDSFATIFLLGLLLVV